MTATELSAEQLDRQIVLLRIYAAFTYPFACIPFLFFYFHDRGIGLQDYTTLISVYYLAMTVAEIPTGILADRFGKKLTMILGPTVLGSGFWIICSFDGFAAFCAGEAVLGLGHALLSGPPSALLFQSLATRNRQGDFLNQESKVHSIRLFGTGGAFLIGGLIVQFWGISLSIAVTGALCFIATLAAFGLRDIHAAEKPTSRNLLASARRDLRIPAVRWIVAYFVILFALLRFPFHTYQPFLSDAGATHPLFVGGLFFTLNMVAAPCSRYLPQLIERFGERRVFWAMPLALAGSFMVMAGQINGIGIALFFAHQIPFGMHWSLIQGFANHHLEDASRATVLSVLSFAGRLCFVILFPILTLSDDVGQSYLWVGIAGILITLICLLMGQRHLDGPASVDGPAPVDGPDTSE